MSELARPWVNFSSIRSTCTVLNSTYYFRANCTVLTLLVLLRQIFWEITTALDSAAEIAGSWDLAPRQL